MGHTAFNRYHRFHNAFQATGPNLTVYTAALPQPCDLNWYPNTSATHHITFDLNSLNIHSKAYDGIDEIQVGNGSRLAIKNAGISKLSPNFNLHYVLHVLKISKNLLSIQKFTSDNNVYVKFHPSCFFVKDRISRKILHHGLSRHGLYHWFSPTAAPPSIFYSSLTSIVDWHAHLGHPADRIVPHVLSKFQLPFISNKKLTICLACQQGKSHQLPFSSSKTK